jgi:shikimate 5-dehydrogenase
MFDEHDELALLCREVGSIVIDNGIVFGSASIDVAGAGSTLRHMLGETYFQETEADVLCLGSGGAGKAVVVGLLNDLMSDKLMARNDKPKNIFVVDIDNSRLDDLQRLLKQIPGQTNTIAIYNETAAASKNDEILKQLSPGSLVVNASGLGKDRPGSPLTDNAVFPTRGIAWELNYRGERKFLVQARSNQDESHLQIHDGWSLFLHNWSQGISRAMKVEISGSTKKDLFEIAARFRPAEFLAISPTR